MKKRIIVSEKGFQTLLEARHILNENLGRQMQKARKILRSSGYSDKDAKEKVESWETKPCFKQNDGFGLSGYARMYVNNEFDSFDNDERARFFNIIDMIAKRYSDLISPDLKIRTTGKELYAEYLYYKYLDEYREWIKTQPKEQKPRERNKHYAIYRIPDFETASEWSNACNWCVTKDRDSYVNETNDGNGIFVFCIRDDYSSRLNGGGEPPYDNYGLSMIAVCVDNDGEIYSCTSRYNHRMGNDGKLFDKEGLEDLLGVSFDEFFYPRTKEEPFVDSKKDYYEWIQEVKADAVELGKNMYLAQRYDNTDYELSTDPLAEYYICYWDENYGEPVILDNTVFHRSAKSKWFGNFIIIQNPNNEYVLFKYGARHQFQSFDEIYHEFNKFTYKHDVLICISEDADDMCLVLPEYEKYMEVDNAVGYAFLTLETNYGTTLYVETWGSSYEEVRNLFLVDDAIRLIVDNECAYKSPDGHFYTKVYPKYGYVIPFGESERYVSYNNPIDGRTVYQGMDLDKEYQMESHNLKLSIIKELKKRNLLI